MVDSIAELDGDGNLTVAHDRDDERRDDAEDQRDAGGAQGRGTRALRRRNRGGFHLAAWMLK